MTCTKQNEFCSPRPRPAAAATIASRGIYAARCLAFDKVRGLFISPVRALLIKPSLDDPSETRGEREGAPPLSAQNRRMRRFNVLLFVQRRDVSPRRRTTTRGQKEDRVSRVISRVLRSFAFFFDESLFLGISVRLSRTETAKFSKRQSENRGSEQSSRERNDA